MTGVLKPFEDWGPLYGTDKLWVERSKELCGQYITYAPEHVIDGSFLVHLKKKTSIDFSIMDRRMRDKVSYIHVSWLHIFDYTEFFEKL